LKRTPATGWIQIGLFTLPVYGLLVAYATWKEVMSLEFSPILTVIIVVALLLALIGNGLLSIAIWRSGSLLRWAGVIWAAATLIFYVLGAAFGMATTGASVPTQPIGGVLMAVSGAWIAWAAVRQRATESISLAPQASPGE
jgi:hypothetical protein